ncbi:uncharacterized protein ACO6RY_18534 [Pungitius sinensis]
MASRRTSTMPSTFKSTEAKSSRSGSIACKPNTGTGKKSVKSGGTIVKSRYGQTSLSKSNSLTNESIAAPPRPSSPKPRVGTPPRRSMAHQAPGTSVMSRANELSMLGKSIMQSTFADGQDFPPSFDISGIKETIAENTVELEKNPEISKRDIEMQTFLLAYITAKMESNTTKAKAVAEAKLMQVMEEEEALHNEVQEKKRQYLLMEQDRQLNELLDLQIAALTPVVETAKQFTKDYKSFATAVDTTRHELPVQNFYIDGDRKEFLDKAETCLKESEMLLLQCTDGDLKDDSTSLASLRDMKTTSKTISQQLSGACSELLELSSLVSRHTVHVQQATEEEQLGAARTHQLFCPKQ